MNTLLHRLPPADPAQDHFADLPNGLRLCYRSYGDAAQPTIVLIAGLGLQLVSWPLDLIEGLVAQGLHVLIFDNRDMGRSSYVKPAPPPRWRLLLRMVPRHHYRIQDMADDLAQLLQVLGIVRTHVLGMSMGGMIAQSFAAQYPERVLSLTSIFSTTGNPRVGFAAGSTVIRLLLRGTPRTLEQAQDGYVRIMRHIGNPKVPGIEQAWRDHVAQAWQRTDLAHAQAGYERQIAAIIGSGDRSAQLYRISTPTLVIHGDKDRIVHPSGGMATARAIGGARFYTMPGMRHQLDASITPQLLELIVPHVQAAQQDVAPD